MSAMSAANTKTSIDYIAAGYWQDFIAARPIAGGIAYEAQLRGCQLDESLASLQRLDTFITQIRREHIKANTLNEEELLIDDRYRNLLLFLAFYAGRVLAQQWQNVPHWYGSFELRKYYPELTLTTDDFYQQMAVRYRSEFDENNDNKSNDNNHKNKNSAELFFALEPIGLRLFGGIDRNFEALQGGQVASGLYQAVNARLPDSSELIDAKMPVVNKDSSRTYSMTNSTTNLGQTVIENKENEIAAQNGKAKAPIINTYQDKKTVISEPVETVINHSETEDIQSIASSKSIALAKNKELLKNEEPTENKTVKPTPEVFTQLLIELDEIEITQKAGNADYQQACQTLNQFERHIARQHKPRAQVEFSEQHQQARQQALMQLEQAATDGHTAAMLRLAMYELLGEGLPVTGIVDEKTDKEVETPTEADEKSGAAWVKQAANNKDSRAQRLLSKMYYQGLGVAQDIGSGKLWLEQAAKNGHPEAAQIVAQWQQAQTLITTKQEEQHSMKRYQLLITAIVVGALLLFIFV